MKTNKHTHSELKIYIAEIEHSFVSLIYVADLDEWLYSICCLDTLPGYSLGVGVGFGGGYEVTQGTPAPWPAVGHTGRRPGNLHLSSPPHE